MFVLTQFEDRSDLRSDSGAARSRRPSSAFNQYRESTADERSQAEAGWTQSADIPDEVTGDFGKFRLSNGLISKLRSESLLESLNEWLRCGRLMIRGMSLVVYARYFPCNSLF